jgi:AbrB family looped-hinge helix DNA binding protein
MVTIKIGRRGQITIPREIRRKLGLNEGDTITLIPEKEQVVLRPVTETLLDLRGSVTVSEPQDFDAIRQQVIAERAAQSGRHAD